jgi:hypothetical protein
MPKSKLSQQVSQVNVKTSVNEWDLVIADAEEQIRTLSHRRIALKASIALFRQKRENGEPVPEGLLASTHT